MTISLATTESDIRRCYPVMQQLRPHLTEEQFVEQVVRQQNAHGYVLAYVEGKEQGSRNKEENSDSGFTFPVSGLVMACAGFRIAEYLMWGKALYVDDLIADENTRGSGYASKLFDWMVEYAVREGCDQFHLDSGTGPNRYRAHRFYLHKGMDITSHHFALKLK